MNAAGQRRLTPVLGGVAIALAVGLGVLLTGVGRGVRWDDPGAPEPLPAVRPVSMPTPQPLTQFAEVWQRPLFTADRKPVASADGDDSSSNIGDLELTGIIMTSGLRMALLQDKGKDATVRVKEGSPLQDGHWTLASLTPRSAIFDNGGEHRELTLKVSAPAALVDDAKRQNAVPGQPGAQGQTRNPATPGPGGIRIEQQPPSGMTGPSLPRPAESTSRDAPERQDENALQRARIEALKQAVQKRRLEQQQQQQQSQGQDSK